LTETYYTLSSDLYQRILEYLSNALRETESQKLFMLANHILKKYEVIKEVSELCENVLKNKADDIKERLRESKEVEDYNRGRCL